MYYVAARESLYSESKYLGRRFKRYVELEIQIY